MPLSQRRSERRRAALRHDDEGAQDGSHGQRRPSAREREPGDGRDVRRCARDRELAGADLVGVGPRGLQEHAVHVGVLLDERRQSAGAQAEGVLPDQHLGVAVDAGADADGGDGQRRA